MTKAKNARFSVQQLKFQSAPSHKAIILFHRSQNIDIKTNIIMFFYLERPCSPFTFIVGKKEA